MPRILLSPRSVTMLISRDAIDQLQNRVAVMTRAYVMNSVPIAFTVNFEEIQLLNVMLKLYIFSVARFV